MKNPAPKQSIVLIGRAIAVLCAASPFAALADDAAVQQVIVTGQGSGAQPASLIAPSQAPLGASTPQSVVGDSYLRNDIAPVSDYTQAVSMTPGVFAFSPNGVGLADTKLTMRGLTDANFVISFDGIPFNDTNGVSHHSWVFFPAPFLGGAVVDRSPGTAASIGQATYGGTVDLRSRVLGAQQRTSATVSDGTWHTRLDGLEYESGDFGGDHKSNFLVNAHEMKSDGYQTYNDQDRKAGSGKFRTLLTPDVELTLFGSLLELTNNTPSIKGVSRANYNIGNFTYLLSGDPTQANYFGYNFYDIYTGWAYAGVKANLGDGWKLEDKVYSYRYNNKENYNSATTISASSAVDKLNSYTTKGNLLRLSREFSLGTLRTGLWFDRAASFRYQIPSNPKTWVDEPAPNFSETYVTTTLQPYLEFEFRPTDNLKVTPGIKFSQYKQSFVHLQDNGGAVGPLGGTVNKTTDTITGGAPSLANSITYRDTMPNLSLSYMLRPNWSVYAQAAVGDQIPSTSVFDVTNAQVSPPPKATTAKTVQAGTVFNSADFTASADIYHTALNGTYTALPPDAFGNVGYVLSGAETDQGIEVEGNHVLGAGFSIYANATVGSLKYSTGLWVAGAPSDTETLGLNYRNRDWDIAFSANRVGKQYGDDKAGNHEAFVIDPVTVANLFVNYTLHAPFAAVQRIKFQFGIDNLFNTHAITGIASPAAGSSSANPSAADLLSVVAGRALTVTATVDF